MSQIFHVKRAAHAGSREKETQGPAMLEQLERFWRSVETEKNSTQAVTKPEQLDKPR